MADERTAPLDLPTARARIAALAREPAARALAAADAGAGRVLLVGGALRDAALGLPVGDLDAVALRDGAALAGRLADAIGGRLVPLAPGRFTAYRVVAADHEVDLWDLEGGSLDADLARRDFTINALALALDDGALLDPHGGLVDLAGRRLRAVRPETFAEDPLRVLRLARFAATLAGFTIDPATAAAARAAAPGLDRVAGERIREELATLARRAHPVNAQRALVEAGAFPGLWSGQWIGLAAATDGIAAFARLDGARTRLGDARASDESMATDHALRLALVHSPADRAREVERLFRRAVLSRRQARAALALLAATTAAAPEGDVLRLLLWRLGPLWTAGLALDAALAPAATQPAWQTALEAAQRLVDREGDRLLAPRPLVSGAEAAALAGVPSGPRLGAALHALVEAQVLGAVDSIDGARAFLARYAREQGG